MPTGSPAKVLPHRTELHSHAFLARFRFACKSATIFEQSDIRATRQKSNHLGLMENLRHTAVRSPFEPQAQAPRTRSDQLTFLSSLPLTFSSNLPASSTARSLPFSARAFCFRDTCLSFAWAFFDEAIAPEGVIIVAGSRLFLASFEGRAGSGSAF